MIRALVLAVLLAASPATAEPLWMPPIAHQTLPPHMRAVPVYRLVPSERIAVWCASFFDTHDLETRGARACNGWKGGIWYVVLRKDVSPAQQWCDARHEFGHEWEREITGDANYWHEGWTWQECSTLAW